MAERVYEFRLKNETNDGGRSPITNTGDGGGSTNEQRRGLLTKEGAQAFAKFMVAYGTTKSFATQIINHNVSMVQLHTGSNELQVRADFINNVAQKGIGILEAAGTGALVGGLPVALLGLGLGTAHTIIGFAQNQERLNTERTVENVGLLMQNIRAGANGSRRL